MKLEAKQRLEAWRKPSKPDLTLDIYCRDPETLQTLINFLHVVQYNGQVGHSALVGAFFDGDGAGQIHIDGLPNDKDAISMAKALGEYGDGHLAEVGPYSARGWNTAYPDGVEIPDEYTCVRSTKVFPEEE